MWLSATATYLLLPTLLEPSSPCFSDKAGVHVQRRKNGCKSPRGILLSSERAARHDQRPAADYCACGEADIGVSAVLGSQTAKNGANIGQTFIRCREAAFRMNGNAALWLPSGEISHTEPPRSQNKMWFSQKKRIKQKNRSEILLHHVCLHEHTLRESRQSGTSAKSGATHLGFEPLTSVD